MRFQLEAIREHIPWTRLVEDAGTSLKEEEVDLLEFIRSRREICVLKPVDDYGGKGITFGWECSESEWDDAIAHALEVPFVVQQRAGVERTSIPVYRDGEAAIEELNVDFDPFLFMGESLSERIQQSAVNTELVRRIALLIALDRNDIAGREDLQAFDCGLDLEQFFREFRRVDRIVELKINILKRRTGVLIFSPPAICLSEFERPVGIEAKTLGLWSRERAFGGLRSFLDRDRDR